MRAPSVIPLKSFFDSLPYSGNLAIRKYHDPSSVLYAQSCCCQPVDQRHHRRNMLRRARHDLRLLDRQRIQVFKKRLFISGVYSPIAIPAAAALRIILSSTSVMFMTCRA